MSPDRFKAMAEAYGGDLRHWPEAERRAAEQKLIDDPSLSQILAEARELDAILACYEVPAPAAGLQHRIATKLQLLAARRFRLRRWLSGIGAMGIVTAGALAGATCIALLSVSAPAEPDPGGIGHLYEQSGFGNFGAAE